jgi:hypothetical protein
VKKIFCIILFCLLVSTSFATDWYVRIDGDDSSCNGQSDAGSGSTPNCAFAYIQKAENSASDGDTIYVGAGTYTNSATYNSGTQHVNIDVDNLTITGPEVWPPTAIIDLEADVEVSNGFVVSKATTGVTIKYFEIKRGTQAIIVQAETNNTTLSYQNIHDQGRHCQQKSSCDGTNTCSGSIHGVQASPGASNSDNITLKNSALWNIGADPHGNCNNNVNYGKDHNVYARGYGWVIENCVFGDSLGGYPVKLDSVDNSGHSGPSHKVVNCTFLEDSTTSGYGHIRLSNDGYDDKPTDVVIANNIFYKPKRRGGRQPDAAIQCRWHQGTMVVYNNVTTAGDMLAPVARHCATAMKNADEQNNKINISGDMGMADPDNQDPDSKGYQLTSSASNMINQGTATYAPATDIIGTSRPVGARDDIGVHEYSR